MATTATQFRLSIGAKRQLTLPAELLEQLQIPERGELLVEVVGDQAVVTPIISVPRTHLPEELRRKFESRRGARPSDIPLAQLLSEVGYRGAPKQSTPAKDAPALKAAAPRRLSQSDHLASLTPNERKVLLQSAATKSARPRAKAQEPAKRKSTPRRPRHLLSTLLTESSPAAG